MRREYHIHPFEVARYTPRELHDLFDDMNERERQAREAGE